MVRKWGVQWRRRVRRKREKRQKRGQSTPVFQRQSSTGSLMKRSSMPTARRSSGQHSIRCWKTTSLCRSRRKSSARRSRSSALTSRMTDRSWLCALAGDCGRRFRSSRSPFRIRRPLARSGTRPTGDGREAPLERTTDERIPVIRVPGHRPAPLRSGDARAAGVLDPGQHHADPLPQPLRVGEFQGVPAIYDGVVDFNNRGDPIGIEITAPTKTSLPGVKRVLCQLGLLCRYACRACSVNSCIVVAPAKAGHSRRCAALQRRDIVDQLVKLWGGSGTSVFTGMSKLATATGLSACSRGPGSC
jgi:hypothetical protein